MELYNRVKGKETEVTIEQNEESSNPVVLAGCHIIQTQSVDPETTINLIKNQTRIRTYQVTGSLNHVSNFILNTIHPVFEI